MPYICFVIATKQLYKPKTIMEKAIFADADNNEYIKVVDMKNFIIPRNGDLIRWMNMTFYVEGVIHNYDKKELLISVIKK